MLKKISIIILILGLLSLNFQNFSKYNELYADDIKQQQKEIESLEKKIKKKSEEIKDNEKKIEDLQTQITTNEDNQKKINSKINDTQKDIKVRESSIKTYLVFMQKITNKNMWLKELNGEDFLLYLYNLNKVVWYMNDDFLSLKNKVQELEEEQELYKQTEKNLTNSVASLEEQTIKLNKVYKEMNEDLVELEKQIDLDIVYDKSALVAKEDREDLMRQVGIDEKDFEYVDYIIFNESSWNFKVSNPYSGAYGLCQSLPGDKMASAGDDWQTNPKTQLLWCDGYAKARYGSWQEAKNFWEENHWW